VKVKVKVKVHVIMNLVNLCTVVINVSDGSRRVL